MSLIPLWVYPFLFILVLWGIKLCSSCTVKVNRLYVLPLVFILISGHHFIELSNDQLANVMSWIVAICIGMYIGHLNKQNAAIKIDPANGLISLPKDNSIVTMVMILFGVEFLMAAIEGIGPPPFAWFNPICMFISGGITGIVIGGNATHLYRYRHNMADSI